jgi:hypothetical protein
MNTKMQLEQSIIKLQLNKNIQSYQIYYRNADNNAESEEITIKSLEGTIILEDLLKNMQNIMKQRKRNS